MSILYQYQLTTKNSDESLSAAGGLATVFLFTGAGTEIDVDIDTPYAQMFDTADSGVYECVVSKTNIYSVVVNDVIMTGDEGVKIDADPPRVINLDIGEVLEIKVNGTVYCTIGRGTTDTDIGYIKLPNAGGTGVHIYPNSEGNGVLADTIIP